MAPDERLMDHQSFSSASVGPMKRLHYHPYFLMKIFNLNIRKPERKFWKKNLNIAKRFYAWLRWNSWCIDESKIWQSAVETDLVNNSWCIWSMWLKSHSSLEAMIGTHLICVKWWGDWNIPHINKWNKQKFQIFIMLSPWFSFVWDLTGAL